MTLMSPHALSCPGDYVVQELRFVVDEGFGCDNAPDGSILGILLLESWNVLPPLVSVTVYYRTSALPCTAPP